MLEITVLIVLHQHAQLIYSQHANLLHSFGIKIMVCREFIFPSLSKHEVCIFNFKWKHCAVASLLKPIKWQPLEIRNTILIGIPIQISLIDPKIKLEVFKTFSTMSRSNVWIRVSALYSFAITMQARRCLAWGSLFVFAICLFVQQCSFMFSQNRNSICTQKPPTCCCVSL